VSRGWASAAAAGGMFVFGVANALLGAVLPLLSLKLRFDLAQAGALFTALNFGVLLTVAAAGRRIDRSGVKPAMTAGPLIVAAALVLAVAADSYAMLLAAAFVLGLGGGALNAATNTLIADLNPDPRRKNAALIVLGMFFGLGALTVPFAAGVWLDRVGLAGIVWSTAGLCAAAGGYAALLAFPGAKNPDPRRRAGTVSLLRTRSVQVTMLLLFFQSGNEVILAGYTTTFLTRDLGVGVRAASWALTGLWATVILARLGLARLALVWSGDRIVMVSAAAALLGALLLAASHSIPWAGAAIVLCGAGLAGVFPTILGMTGTRFREDSGAVFGVLLTGSRVGSMVLPWLAGHLAERAGPRAALALVALGAAAILALQAISRKWHGVRPGG